MSDALERAHLEPDASTVRAPVIIVGGGPVGLSLALGLAHHGVRSLVVERDTTTSRGSRAFGVWGRTLETFDDWGCAQDLLDRGDPRDLISPVDVRTGRPIFTMDFSSLRQESAMPGIVLLPQAQTELALREAIQREPLADVVLGQCVAVSQDGSGVEVRVRTDTGEQTFAGEFLVGADGSRSTVRESQGLRHEGKVIDIRLLVFDVEVDDADLALIRLDSKHKGLVAALRFAPGHWRVLASLASAGSTASQSTEGLPPREPDLPLAELEPHVVALFGNREHQVTWQSQTTLYQQRITSFRAGRIVFAGDAAHLISPAGGQGMNQGIQDAENLAWTLAAVVNGADADVMLDGYDLERQKVADVVARRAFINSLLEFRTPTWLRPVAFLGMRMLTRVPFLIRKVVRRLSMRDLRYRARHSTRLRSGHRAVGRRVPDVVVDSGERLSDLMSGRAAVITVGTDFRPSVPDGVVAVNLRRAPHGMWVPRGSVLVVRPDRHVGAVLRKPSESQIFAALWQCCGVC